MSGATREGHPLPGMPQEAGGKKKKKYPPWLGPSACCLLRASPGLRTAKARSLRNPGEEPAGVSPQDPEGKGRPAGRAARWNRQASLPTGALLKEPLTGVSPVAPGRESAYQRRRHRFKLCNH